MDLVNALEFLKLKEVSKVWIDAVWDLEFTETEPLDEGIEDGINRKGPKAFRTLYERLLPYSADADADSQSVWSVLGESGVSARSLVAVLSYFVLGGKAKMADVQQRLSALEAAALYALLLRIPGSVANKCFHQVLFDTCTEMTTRCMPQSAGKKRKKDAVKSSQGEGKRPKPHRNEGNEQGEADEADEEEELHFSAPDLVKIRDAIVALVKSLLRLLQTFPLKDKPQSADTCAQVFVKLTGFEPALGELAFGGAQDVEDMRSMPELAYYGLWLLCSPNHGDEKESLRRVFHRLLYVVLMMSKDRGKPTLLMPTQATVSARDQAVRFLCHVVDELKDPALPFLRILLQHVCCQMVEKAEHRCHGAQAVSRLLSRMPCEEYASFLQWLFDYSRNPKVSYRLFALDVAMALLGQPERGAEGAGLGPELASFLSQRFLIQGMVFGRASDASPSVRAHALACLAQCVEMPSLNATRSVQELFSTTSAQTVLEADGTTGAMSAVSAHHTQKTYRTLQFKTIEISNFENISYESKETMALIKRRICDPKTNVRKSALQAMVSLLKHGVIALSQENLLVLSERCRDPALSVKKKALQCLMELLSAQPDSGVVQRAWLRGVVPALVDPESSVQEKSLEALDQVLLLQVKSHASYSGRDKDQRLAWDLLGLLCHDCQDLSCYFSRAFSVWSSQNKFTPAFVSNLVSHTGAGHAAGAWLLLSKVASCSPKLDYGKILDAWDEMLRSKNTTVTTSCHILGVIGDISAHLNEDTKRRIVDDIMTWLQSWDLPLEVISASVETLCCLGRRESITHTQKFLDQHCGELVSVCETYLCTVILNEHGAHNLNQDLVVKHLYTLGVASLHCPSRVGKRTVLLLQSILTSSVTPPPEEGPEQLPSSQPLSQFKSNSTSTSTSTMPSTVRAHAVTTLGKLCLQHEDLTLRYLPAFARELEQSAELAVRSNVVVVMCDLCVRYTNMVERYLPNISACLRDTEPLIREQTLTLLTNLLQEEFVKWKGSLFFRFVAVLVDPDPAISSLCEYCLVHLLLKKSPAMFSQHFIECIFHFNSYQKHKTYNRFPQTDSEKAQFSLKGAQNKDRRFRIYRFLLEHFTDAERFNITTRISQTVLACFADGDLPLDADGAEVLSEALGVLSLQQIKLRTMMSSGLEAEEQEDEQVAMAAAVIQVARKKVVSQVQKKVFIENMIPIIIALKSLLEHKRSPVLKDLMSYLQVTMQDYRSEVKEFFAADEQLAAELEYNLKMFEKEKELEYNLKMFEKEKQMEDKMADCSLAREAPAAPAEATPAPTANRLLPTGLATPQIPLPTNGVLNSPRMVQSARRSSQTRGPQRGFTPLRASAPPKGKVCHRAISTPHGNIDDVTFGEGLSAIFSDRRSGSSDRDDDRVLHLTSPEQQTPVPRQWNVESPLSQKRARRLRP